MEGYPQGMVVIVSGGGTVRPGGPDPVAGFAFYLSRERECATRTVEAYLYWLSRYVTWLADNSLTLLTARPLDVRAFSTSGAWGRKTRAQVLSSLKSFYAYCEMEEMVVRSPARSVPHPRQFKRIGPVWDKGEAQALLDTARGLTTQLLAGLGLCAGLRVGESLGLTPDDVHLRQGLIHVRRTIGEPTTKSRREREVPIHGYLREPLRRAVKMDRERLVYDLETPQGGRDRLVRLCRDAKVPYLGGTHAMRRTFGSQLAANGVREGVIRHLLGHDLRTEDLYMRVSPADARRAVEGLGY